MDVGRYKLHGVTSQKTVRIIVTFGGTSNLVVCVHIYIYSVCVCVCVCVCLCILFVN